MLAYKRKGQGQPLVFIHGFLSGGQSFQFVADDLSAHYDVIVVDLPGIGRSVMEKTQYTIEQYAEQIEELLQSMGVYKAIWIGHSMGGYIALAAAQQKIAHMKQLVLLFSGVGADSEEAKKKRQSQQQEIAEQGTEAFVDRMINNFFPPNSPQEAIEFMRNVAKDATADGMDNELWAMQHRVDQQQFINTTTLPIAIIEGANDDIMPKINTTNQSIQRIEVPTGHFGMAENPQAVAAALKKVFIT
ncbi:alpha/beta fold hydrolase [Kurthia sibirica]|uniref:Alpha/beta hydrolase n=1 Tax=Kurthia sibirica TaxID=202750 RepID=A0A2U3AQY5_9BACL|nr:alpha/beta hydrolase [Kurthia sibirica]PWI26970.1 alpha/beta hydrolase [Kurthia sibirica]GEK32481.1 alpha/beta hydrolase [Kurthia sibirica]